VPGRTRAGRLAEALLKPDRLPQLVGRRPGIVRAEVERAELMSNPRGRGEILRLLGGGQGAAERADQIEPAADENEEAVKRPQQPQLLIEATVTIEPLGQAEQ
jgi:hypothetical protein